MQIKIAHFWKCTYMESQEVLAFLASFLLAISSSEQRIVKNVPCSTLALFLRIGTWKPFSVLAMWTSMLPPGLFTKWKNGTKIPVFFSKPTFGGMIWNLKSSGQWIKVMLAFTSFTWASWPMGKIFSLPLAKVLLAKAPKDLSATTTEPSGNRFLSWKQLKATYTNLKTQNNV